MKRDWAEDKVDGDNIYITRCVLCGQEFTGHKHRAFCKECAEPTVDKAAERSEASKEGEDR